MKQFIPASLNLGTFKEFKNSNEFLQSMTDDEVKFQYERLMNDKIFINDLYQVHVDVNSHRENILGVPIIHLSIKRIDKEPIHDWREMQEIKNLILGNEVEAVELYPAESRLVDMANQYHMWCLPEGDFFPFGWNERAVTDKKIIPNAKQRKFKIVK